MPTGSSSLYAFGCYRLDSASRTLTRSGEPVPLPPKTFDLLVLLAGSGGRLLTRSELIHALWPDATVEDGSLTFQISALRKSLGEDAWIESVPKHGYRFNAPVQIEPAVVAAPVAEKPAPTHHLLKAWGLGVILLASAASYWVNRNSGRTESSGAIYQPVRITSYAGSEEWPDVSPDGSQVAFAWDGPAGDNYDIYVKLAGPGEPLRLTDNPGRDISPAWSPDGRWIAFVRFPPVPGPVRILTPERAGVYVKPALGGSERRVHELWTRFPLVEYPRKLLTWTPDGKSIIAAGRPSLESTPGLWLLPTAGGEPHPLTIGPEGIAPDHSPSFAPNGKCLAFMRSTAGRADVFALRMKGDTPDGAPRRLTFESRAAGSLAWTSSGRSILYSSGAHTGFRGLRRIVMAAECDSASREESLPFGEQTTTFGVSKTGRLVYAKETRSASLWRWDTSETANPLQVFKSTQDDHTPAYAPDGQRIAFASTRSGSEEIWLSNVDGSSPVQLTFTSGPTTANPHFSPDGRTILFNSRKEGRSDLYTIELSSGALRRLTSHPAEEIQPSWSRDGAFIYFASDSSKSGFWQIQRMPAEGGPWVQVTQDGGLYAQESLDGKTLYFSDDEALWSLPTADIGSGRTNATKLVDGLVYGLNFAVTTSGIYYMSAGPFGRQSTINFFDFRTRKARSVLRIDKLWWFGLSVSPDERTVLYSVRDQDGTDLELIDSVP
jgi:Tol biopolymer transport system component/DNA-binding winged helix-turn-helix (wHTH) protein